jgi:hypothetical protein
MKSGALAGATIWLALSAIATGQTLRSGRAFVAPPAVSPPPPLVPAPPIPANPMPPGPIGASASTTPIGAAPNVIAPMTAPSVDDPTVTLDLVADASSVPPAGQSSMPPPLVPGGVRSTWPSFAPTSNGPLANFAIPNVLPAGADSWWRVPEPTRLYFLAEALILHRDNRSYDQPVVVNGTTGDTVMTTRDLGFTNWAAGARLAAGYRLLSGAAIEVNYFGFQDFSATASASSPFMLSAPAGLGAYTFDYHDANSVNVNYSSQLQNVELNYWLPSSGPISFLGGFRYLSWNESFGIQSNSSYYTTPEYSNYTAQTSNNLLGGQVGVRSQFEWRRLRLDIAKKIGLFGNAFWQRSLVQDYGNSYVLEDNWIAHSGVAVVGDLGINLGYRVTDFMTLRAGYNLIWIDGLALAPNELDFHLGQNSATGHNHNGSVFLQGVNVGFDIRW